jgi:hypothetical protein
MRESGRVGSQRGDATFPSSVLRSARELYTGTLLMFDT